MASEDPDKFCFTTRCPSSSITTNILRDEALEPWATKSSDY